MKAHFISRSPPWLRALQLFVGCALVLAFAAQAEGGELSADLARAQQLVDAGNPLAVLPLLEPWTKGKKASPEALLITSTARFMLGDVERGEQQLKAALAGDPALRQGWLNLGALRVAGGDYDAALKAFEKAEALDPKADDNGLNLGAVYLLSGELDPARVRFARYLEEREGSSPEAAAEAHFLVASNYAVAGYTRLAVEHLAAAFGREERYRLRARTEATFDPLRDDRGFQELMQRDSYKPPAGARRTGKRFLTRYDAENGQLLGAVIDALREMGINFDPRIEVTPGWALIWGDLRIKVTNTAENEGLIELTALGDDWPEQRWATTTDEIFRRTAVRLNAR